jgi:hypothetical protein
MAPWSAASLARPSQNRVLSDIAKGGDEAKSEAVKYL